MSRVHSRLALLAVAAVLPAASCSSTTDPAKTAAPLSASEAGAIGGSLLTQATAAFGQGALNSDGSYTAPCPQGGTIRSLLSAPVSTSNSDGTRTITTTATITPQACVVGTGARQITVTGDPSAMARISGTLMGGTPVSGVSVVTGGFKWAGGSCQLNYTVTTTGLALAQRQIAVAGTVCGQSVNTTAAF